MSDEKESTDTITVAAEDLAEMRIPVSIEKKTVIIIQDDTDEVS